MNRKQEILTTALEMFNLKGYANVGVREIARQLNISPENLSYHFPRKEDVLFTLLQEFGEKSSSLIRRNSEQEKSIENFLLLVKSIFHVQYEYVGIWINNPNLRQELQATKRVNYAQVVQRRREEFRKIFCGLSGENQIKATESDIEFLVSFMGLFMRFAIHEAFLLGHERNESEIINHYLNMLVKQISLFSTLDGNESIEKFRTGNLL